MVMERKRRRELDHRKIRFSRMGTVSIILGLIVAMLLYTSRILQDVAVSNAHDLAENKIATVASQIENYLNTARGMLWATAGTVDYMARNGRTSEDILRYITEESEKHANQFDENHNGIYGYVVGEFLDGTRWDPPAEYDPLARPWYSAAIRADGEAAIVPPHTDAQTGMQVISVSRMLSNGKDVLSVNMDMDHIQEMIGRLHVREKGDAFIIDEDGRIIAHRDAARDGRSLTGLNGGRALMGRLMEAQDGHFPMILDGRENTVFTHQIMDRWRLVIVIGNSDLYTEIRWRMAATILVWIAVFFAIARFYYLDYRNERDYSLHIEMMRLEEQRQAYEARALKLEKDAADHANRAKSNFLAEMSHEIRTPINAVLGMNEMILRESRNEEVRGYARNVESAGRNLLAIINDILDFSKIEAGRMEIVNAPYRLSSLLNDVGNIALFQARAKGLTFDADVDGTLPDGLYGDEVRVRQVLSNLLNNAVKYTKEGGVTLRVRGTRKGGALNLTMSVADRGIGIREEDMKNLFVSFERADEAQNKSIEGTGLGLAIVQNLLRLMNGSIQVKSRYGEGSVFRITIPQGIVLDEPVGDFREKFAQGARDMAAYHETFRAPDARVLVVDDMEMNLTVIYGLLRETGLNIDTAASGAAALALTKDNPYDLILMDQRMPEMDGTEALRRIREQDGRNRETPAICLTADAVQGARERYLAQGFADYVLKPVEGAVLEAALMKHLPAGKVFRARQEGAQANGAVEKDIAAARATAEGLSPEEALEEIRTLTPRWLAAYRGLAETLRPFFEAKDGTRAEALPEMGADELRELYDGILEFAQMYDLDSIERLLKETEGYAIPEAERERFALVKECARNSDWAGLREAAEG